MTKVYESWEYGDPSKVFEIKQGRWPRQMAQAIFKLPKEEREAALQLVPQEWREWVGHYLKDWERRKNERRS